VAPTSTARTRLGTAEHPADGNRVVARLTTHTATAATSADAEASWPSTAHGPSPPGLKQENPIPRPSQQAAALATAPLALDCNQLPTAAQSSPARTSAPAPPQSPDPAAGRRLRVAPTLSKHANHNRSLPPRNRAPIANISNQPAAATANSSSPASGLPLPAVTCHSQRSNCEANAASAASPAARLPQVGEGPGIVAGDGIAGVYRNRPRFGGAGIFPPRAGLVSCAADRPSRARSGPQRLRPAFRTTAADRALRPGTAASRSRPTS
jgi:hypothetical protein